MISTDEQSASSGRVAGVATLESAVPGLRVGKSAPWPRSHKVGKTWRLTMADAWMGSGSCPASGASSSLPHTATRGPWLLCPLLVACSDTAPPEPQRKGLSFQGSAKEQGLQWAVFVVTGATGEGADRLLCSRRRWPLSTWSAFHEGLTKVTPGLVWGP